MIQGMDGSKYHTGSDVKNMLLKTFEKSFEDKMKHEFEKKLRNNGLNIFKDDIGFFYLKITFCGYQNSLQVLV